MSYDDWKTTEPVERIVIEEKVCVGCGEYVSDCECDQEPPEPDYGYVPYEETARYREEMTDAGRGHLLK